MGEYLVKQPKWRCRSKNCLLQLVLVGGIGSASALGCLWHDRILTAPWENLAPTTFSVSAEDEAVAQVDIATAHWRLGEAMLEQDIWTELDEQFIAAEQRRLLTQNGLRLGLMRAATGTKLQAMLSDPQYAKPQQNSISTDFIHWWTYVGGKLTEVPKTMPLCSVEAHRVVMHIGNEVFWPIGAKVNSAEMLIPGENAMQRLEQIELGFSARLQKLPEGRTKLSIVPVVKHSLEKQTTTDIFLDSLRKKGGIERHEERLESLAVEATLGTDQYLVISSQPNMQEGSSTAMSFGELAFLDATHGQQIMLIVRGASLAAIPLPDQPKRGQAWPLAWQAAEMTQPARPALSPERDH
jgi:hypothetical protein